MAFSHTKVIKAEYRATLSGDYLEQRLSLATVSFADYHKLTDDNDALLRQLKYLKSFRNLMYSHKSIETHSYITSRFNCIIYIHMFSVR